MMRAEMVFDLYPEAWTRHRLDRINHELYMMSITSNPDIESSHCRADELVAEMLELLGQSQAAQSFRKMEKWYA